MFTVEMIGEQALKLRLISMPAAVIAQLKRAADKWTIRLQAHIVRDKLSGQVLKRRSSRLVQSIQRRVVATDTEVSGVVYSSGDVKYARILELGGSTRPHDIFPNKAKALAFMMGGKQVFAKIVHHPGSHFRPRRYMASSLADYAAEISTDLKLAVVRGLQAEERGA